MANKKNIEVLKGVIETKIARYSFTSCRQGVNRWKVTRDIKTPVYRHGIALTSESFYCRTKKDAIAKMREIVPAATWEFVNGLCLNHTGKMFGMVSFSTSCLENPRCIERMKNGSSVCAHCFAERQQKRQASTRAKLSRNTALVTSSIMSESYFPVLSDYKKIRLESFGDLMSETQAENYMRFAEVNKHASVALWTKNPDILYKALEKRGFRKPSNMIVIFSSYGLNKPMENMLKLYTMPNGKPMIDKLFTVYDKNHADEVNINCGARSCMTCERCYKKRTAASVNELLK